MSQCSLLIVDDHAMLRNMLADLAKCASFDQIWMAENGAQAVQVADAHSPDVVLMDYRLRLENGCRLGEKIRECCPGALCVIISALGTEDMEAAREDCGPDVEFLDKAELTLDVLRGLRDRICAARSRKQRLSSPAA